MIKREIKLFFTALSFMTRIPVTQWANLSSDGLNKSSKYFSLVGWVVGFFGASVFFICNLILPVPIAVVLSTASTVLLTGGFHEDAFADVCDGFGGGWTKEKILTIMKDSRIGVYGALGLLLMLIGKFFTLFEINPYLIPVSIIASHSLSRLASTSMIFTHNYVRENEDAKAKPLAIQIKIQDYILAVIFGVLPIFLFLNPIYFLLIIPVWIAKFFIARYFNKWIGGYTGDCLGSIQQVTEVVFYLGILIIQENFLTSAYEF